MKRKSIFGLIAIGAIVAVAIFAGCVEKDAPTPIAPEETPIPTISPLPENKYSRGDILQAKGQSSEYAYLILNYAESNDSYQTTIIQVIEVIEDKKFVGFAWAYTGEPKKWNDREYIEKTLGISKINHIDPATVKPYITPTPTPTQEIKEPKILSMNSYFDNLGYANVVGEVKNNLLSNIHYVKLTATFYDAEDTVIGTDYTYTELDVLKPNQKSPFELSSYPDKIKPSRYKVHLSYKETNEEPFAGLKIRSHSAKIDELGYHEIVGEVKNDGTRKTSFVKVICTYYDKEGEVIGTSFTYTDPEDIDAGDRAPFELSSYPRKLRPSSYELQVQGK